MQYYTPTQPNQPRRATPTSTTAGPFNQQHQQQHQQHEQQGSSCNVRTVPHRAGRRMRTAAGLMASCRVTCRECGKTTWEGGSDMAMRYVPSVERCECSKEASRYWRLVVAPGGDGLVWRQLRKGRTRWRENMKAARAALQLSPSRSPMPSPMRSPRLHHHNSSTTSNNREHSASESRPRRGSHDSTSSALSAASEPCRLRVGGAGGGAGAGVGAGHAQARAAHGAGQWTPYQEACIARRKSWMSITDAAKTTISPSSSPTISPTSSPTRTSSSSSPSCSTVSSPSTSATVATLTASKARRHDVPQGQGSSHNDVEELTPGDGHTMMPSPPRLQRQPLSHHQSSQQQQQQQPQPHQQQVVISKQSLSTAAVASTGEQPRHNDAPASETETAPREEGGTAVPRVPSMSFLASFFRGNVQGGTEQ